MKKTVFQRIIALSLCLLVLTGGFSLNSLAADGAATNANDKGSSSSTGTISYDTSELKELLSAISYAEYLAENDEFLSKWTDEQKESIKVVIDAVDALYMEKTDASALIEVTDAIKQKNEGLNAATS